MEKEIPKKRRPRPLGTRGAPKGHPPYPGCETGGSDPIWTEEKINQIAEYLYEFMDNPANLYFKKFIIWLRKTKDIKIPVEYLSRWSNKNENFAAALADAKLMQECRIVEGSLLKKLDSGISKFMLTAVHGYSDKQIIEHQGNETVNIIHFGKSEPKKWDNSNKE